MILGSCSQSKGRSNAGHAPLKTRPSLATLGGQPLLAGAADVWVLALARRGAAEVGARTRIHPRYCMDSGVLGQGNRI